MDAVHAGPRSLRQLLEAALTIGSDLDLHAMLRRIVEAAVSLVDARYGALGVLDETKSGLSDFVTVGIDDGTLARIGALPKGLGLLGSLITEASPVRLADLRHHPESSGFPRNHPPMITFLGVPIRVGGEVFGNLYLTDKKTGEVFTDVDEELALGVAAAAGVAIDHARLLERSRHREAALAAMHEVATMLVAGREPREGLQLVAGQARVLVAADVATIALPDPEPGMLVIDIADGPLGQFLVGQRYPQAGSVSGEVLRSGSMVILEDAATDSRIAQPQVRSGRIGPAAFVALMAEGNPFGTLAVARELGAVPFSAAELDLVRSFAAQAGVILEQDRGRQAAQRFRLLEDQERIARDLHDTVIQRLFATGLSLQGAVGLISDPRARQRVELAIDDLDVTVRHIRTVIFDVESSRSRQAAGIRRAVLDIAREAGRTLGFEPHVSFAGAVDTLVPDDVGRDLEATLREALSNVARHARATRVDVEIAAADEVVLTVGDDGVGLAAGGIEPSGGFGLRSMRTRAEQRGGSFHLRVGEAGGTVVEWRVSLRLPGPG